MKTAKKKAGMLARIDGLATVEGAERFVAKILSSDEAAALTAPLPPHDVLALLRAADDEQRSELLAIAQPEQIRGVIDLECWTGDVPDPMAIAGLLEPLVSTGLEGADRAYDALEGELRTLLFKDRLIVHLREDKDDDVPAAEGSELIQCPDGYYFVEIPDPDGFPGVLRQLLTAVLNKPFSEYQREFECLRHDLRSDLEEAALRWRDGRLADLGFGSREEALTLLSPRDPGGVRRDLERMERPSPPISPSGLAASPRSPETIRRSAPGRWPISCQGSSSRRRWAC